MKPWNIEICDVTLRDGEQTPGVSFTADEKKDIATRLDAIGIEVIEAGFPIVSAHEKEMVRNISRLGLSAKICGLSRACREDVDAAIDAEVDMVGLFIAPSDLHLKYKHKKPRDVVVANALEQLDYAVDHGLIVRFGAEDASRTDPDILVDIYRQAADHKATYVTYAIRPGV
jgi:methanogen homocitrate synthase